MTAYKNPIHTLALIGLRHAMEDYATWVASGAEDVFAEVLWEDFINKRGGKHPSPAKLRQIADDFGLKYEDKSWPSENPRVNNYAITVYLPVFPTNAEDVLGDSVLLTPSPSRYVGETAVYDSPNGDFYNIGFKFDRVLTEDEAQHASQLIGYALASSFFGEGMGAYEVVGGNYIEVAYDSTKSPRDDLGDGYVDFEKGRGRTVGIADIFKEGSPIRVRGEKKGTRLVEPMENAPKLVSISYI